MKGLFSYDSPIMQILSYIGDLLILNFLFLLCCIPIFTIGAAQAGLYTATRVLQDKEDDSSVSAAFFRGFRNGFGTITPVWDILFVLFLAICYISYLAACYGLSLWICVVPIFICMLFLALAPAFHARIECTAKQLLPNCWYLAVSHPLCSLGVAILIWLPLVMFLTNTYLFMLLVPLWGTVYYASAALFGVWLLKKPFRILEDQWNENHPPEVS